MVEQQYRRESFNNQTEKTVDSNELQENPPLAYSDKFQSDKDTKKIRPS